MEKSKHMESAVQLFMDLEARTESHQMPLVCYGEDQTAAALRLGAVRELLISSTPPGNLGDIAWKKRWSGLAAAVGATLVVVSPRNQACARFCEGFTVAGCLRYPVDPALLEEDALRENQCSHSEASKLCQAETGSDCESCTTAPSDTDCVLHDWLVAALTHALNDSAAAESLAIGTELVIFDDVLPLGERLDAATEMLSGEGVPSEMLVEFEFHVCDHFGVDR